MLDTSALTGESVPRDIEPGSEVLSGCINTNGLLTVTVTKDFEESTVYIFTDGKKCQHQKAKAENFITKFAKYYTPIVVISAVLLAVIPPMILGIGNGAIWMIGSLVPLVFWLFPVRVRWSSLCLWVSLAASEGLPVPVYW